MVSISMFRVEFIFVRSMVRLSSGLQLAVSSLWAGFLGTFICIKCYGELYVCVFVCCGSGCCWNPANDVLCIVTSDQCHLYSGHLTDRRTTTLPHYRSDWTASTWHYALG